MKRGLVLALSAVLFWLSVHPCYSDDFDSFPGTPAQVMQSINLLRKGSPEQACVQFHGLLVEDAFPAHEAQIQFYLGRCLLDLKLYYASQYYFMQVLRKGPDNPYFPYALTKLVTIARHTGDNSELIRVVTKIPPNDYPDLARDHLSYLMGFRLFQDGQHARSLTYFNQVSDHSESHLRAMFFKGLVHNEQCLLKSAMGDFRDVVREDAEVLDQHQFERVADLKDQSLLQIARIYYTVQQYDNSRKYYALVKPDSDYFETAVYEASWVDFMEAASPERLAPARLESARLGQAGSDSESKSAQGEERSAQGEERAVVSSLRSDFLPGRNILEMLIDFKNCDFNNVVRSGRQFESVYRPMHEEMSRFVKGYASTEGKASAHEVLNTYLPAPPDDSVLPTALFEMILRNEELAALMRSVALMEEERGALDNHDEAWRVNLGSHLHEIIDSMEHSYRHRAGLLFLGEMARASTHLGSLIEQAQALRAEAELAKKEVLSSQPSGSGCAVPPSVEIGSAIGLDPVPSGSHDPGGAGPGERCRELPGENQWRVTYRVDDDLSITGSIQTEASVGLVGDKEYVIGTTYGKTLRQFSIGHDGTFHIDSLVGDLYWWELARFYYRQFPHDLPLAIEPSSLARIGLRVWREGAKETWSEIEVPASSVRDPLCERIDNMELLPEVWDQALMLWEVSGPLVCEEHQNAERVLARVRGADIVLLEQVFRSDAGIRRSQELEEELRGYMETIANVKAGLDVLGAIMTPVVHKVAEIEQNLREAGYTASLRLRVYRGGVIFDEPIKDLPIMIRDDATYVVTQHRTGSSEIVFDDAGVVDLGLVMPGRYSISVGGSDYYVITISDGEVRTICFDLEGAAVYDPC